MMNVLNVPSERFVQTDSIINFENTAPCVPTERYKHHELFFLPTMPAYGRQALLQHKHHLNIEWTFLNVPQGHLVGSPNNDECFKRSIGTFRANDSIINFENIAPCVPIERYEHY